MWRVFERQRILRICILALVCRFDLSTCLPVEQPTRFSLNTDVADTRSTGTRFGFGQGQEWLGHIADALRIGTGRFVNSVTLARNIIADRAEALASESQNNVATVMVDKSVALNHQPVSLESTQYPPVTNTLPNARESANLENETAQGLFEKPFSKPSKGILESFLSPTPLVDGIKEEEKYGNSGDRFIGIGRALVSGFEGFSNFLNGIIDFPRNAARNTSRGISQALNQVGARLVGLE